jgi:hypothetical protein
MTNLSGLHIQARTVSTSRATDLRRARVALAIVALACASGPRFEEFLASSPPPAPGQGRIVVFTPGRAEAVQWRPRVTVDGEVVGVSAPGTFFSVDRPAGAHQLSVAESHYVAGFGYQLASQPAALALAAGATGYVRVQVFASAGGIQARLEAVDPAVAAEALRDYTHSKAEASP